MSGRLSAQLPWKPRPGQEMFRVTCPPTSPPLGPEDKGEATSSPEAVGPSTWTASGPAVPLPSKIFGPRLHGTPAAHRFSKPGQGFPQRRMPDAVRQCGHLAAHGCRGRGHTMLRPGRPGSAVYRSLLQDNPVDCTKPVCCGDPFHHQAGAMLKLGSKCWLHANGQHAARQTDGRRSAGELGPDNLAPLPDQRRFSKPSFAE